MKQEDLQKIFDANKVLDDKFDVLYKDVTNLVDCNKIELMAELMELGNSSRVFKYWKRKPMDYEETIYEYADGLTMLFFFYNINNKNIALKKLESDIDTVSLFLKLINMYNDFINNNVDNLDEILNWYVFLGERLGFKDDDILKATLNKISKTTDYLNSLES